MTDKQHKVVFQPSGRSVFVLAGTTIVEAAGRAGLNLTTPCGGEGTCGKCRIRITSGANEPCGADRAVFTAEELTKGWRLACQTAVCQDIVVNVPESSLALSAQKILTESRGFGDIEKLPAVRKVYIELPVPSRDDNTPDFERVEREIGPCKAGLEQLRTLPGLLRENNFKGTAVLLDHQLIEFEKGDTTAQCYGAAFDIGTSTIVGSLLDLCGGSELQISSRINPQIAYGDDVVSRISHASACGGCLRELHDEIVAVVNEMIDDMCHQAGIGREHIYEITVAGNTTMEHLFCGIDPAALGAVPFVPAHSKGLMLDARELNILINHRGRVYVFPLIGGFVGGDITAGILVTELATQEGPSVLIDVGTNGEIVLARDGRMWAASTAAGPALEGARISCGMRATRGAVEKVIFDKDVSLSTIGNAAPVGICGSGLIDLAAALLNSGILLPDGRLLTADQIGGDVPESIKNRIRRNQDGQTEFLVYEHPEGRRELRVAITQRDIRELQLAVGAIRAGTEIMLRKTNTKADDIERVFVAGGFGSFIRRTSAQRIGLLPGRIKHKKISFVGNSSLDGAQLALLSTKFRKQAEDIATNVTHVQLSLDSGFQTEFANAMIFPAAIESGAE